MKIRIIVILKVLTKPFPYIIFLLISYSLKGITNYVAPVTVTLAGNNANTGTIAAPWATFEEPISVAIAVATGIDAFPNSPSCAPTSLLTEISLVCGSFW